MAEAMRSSRPAERPASLTKLPMPRVLALLEQTARLEDGLEVTASDVANRTLLQVMHESLVEHGLFPTDKAVKVDRMVALADPLGQMIAR